MPLTQAGTLGETGQTRKVAVEPTLMGSKNGSLFLTISEEPVLLMCALL